MFTEDVKQQYNNNTTVIIQMMTWVDPDLFNGRVKYEKMLGRKVLVKGLKVGLNTGIFIFLSCDNN